MWNQLLPGRSMQVHGVAKLVIALKVDSCNLQLFYSRSYDAKLLFQMLGIRALMVGSVTAMAVREMLSSSLTLSLPSSIEEHAVSCSPSWEDVPCTLIIDGVVTKTERYAA
ncbi:unnamed protein product [Sphagnum balticum]